tara:strand:- start:478 stop:699 length:222 start_codon:yes stop_codon:yes gene_type:complete
MELTDEQKQELDILVRSLTEANTERKRIIEIWNVERDAYALYSDPSFDVNVIDEHNGEPLGIWPPPPFEDNGN